MQQRARTLQNDSKCLLVAAAIAVMAFAAQGQDQLFQVDSERSTASIFIESRGETPVSVNVGIAKVSGLAFFDHHDISKSTVHLYIYPAVKDAKLFDDDGNFRRDAELNLARYMLMSFKSHSASIDSSGGLELSGTLDVTYIDRAATTPWSIAYSGAVPAPPTTEDTSYEVRAVVPGVSRNREPNWPAVNSNLVATISTTDEATPGLNHNLRQSIWPIVVLDEHCTMPNFGADTRGYTGPSCSGTPVLTEPVGEVPAWNAAGYSGRTDPPVPHDRIRIEFRMRLLEAKPMNSHDAAE